MTLTHAASQERARGRPVERAAPRSVQRKGLPLQNHRLAGMLPEATAWERQADDAASRILGGETNVARHLKPVPPASLSLASSPGRPLRRELQAPLEVGFGADLSAVRLHADPHAAAAARSYRAQAFTAGPDIVLGDRPADPATEQGRRLLLHEVAHVLQQTGRPGKSGVIEATPTTGAGEIQRRPGEPDAAIVRRPLPAGGRRRADVKGHTNWVQLDRSSPLPRG